MITQKYINEISYKIIGCAIEVYKHLGPGLLESVYEPCFIDEMKNIGLNVNSQIYVPVHYKGKDLGRSLKLDLLVNYLINVEEKAVELMIPLYKAQLLSYLKLAKNQKDYLLILIVKTFHNNLFLLSPKILQNYLKSNLCGEK